MHHNYQIIDASPEYQNALENLPEHVYEGLQIKLRFLKGNPFSIAKQLRPPLQERHSVRINGYRLICRISLNSHKVFLLSLEPRAIAYR